MDIDLLMYKKENISETCTDGYASIADGQGDIFKEATIAQNSNETLWEPGKTQVVFLGIVNKGNLALKYTTCVDIKGEGLIGSLEYLYLPISKTEYDSLTNGVTDYATLKTAAATKGITPQDATTGKNTINTGVLDEIVNTNEQNETDYIALVVHMKEEAGNEYQGKDVTIGVTIKATQYTAEKDGFASNAYDTAAEFKEDPNCVSKGTLVTLADGSQKLVEELTYDDEILTYNFYEGKFEINRLMIIEKNEETKTQAITIYLDNNSSLRIIDSQSLFDMDKRKYFQVSAKSINEDLGKRVMTLDNGEMSSAKIIDITIEDVVEESYEIYSVKAINFIANNILTNEPFTLQFDCFKIDENYRIDQENLNELIDKYSLYTYEDFPMLSKEQFDACMAKYHKIPISMGWYSKEFLENSFNSFIKLRYE